MKRKLITACILATSIVILMSSALQIASATSYGMISYIVSGPGNVWVLNTNKATGGTGGGFLASDLDPNSLVVTIYDLEFQAHIVDPTRVILTRNMIILFFDPADLPAAASTTKVTATGTGIDFMATGPGFTIITSPGPN